MHTNFSNFQYCKNPTDNTDDVMILTPVSNPGDIDTAVNNFNNFGSHFPPAHDTIVQNNFSDSFRNHNLPTVPTGSAGTTTTFADDFHHPSLHDLYNNQKTHPCNDLHTTNHNFLSPLHPPPTTTTTADSFLYNDDEDDGEIAQLSFPDDDVMEVDCLRS